MRTILVPAAILSLALAPVAGCGAAPGHEEETTPESAQLQPLSVAQPDARLVGVDGVNANFEIAVMIANPNAAAVTMRRLDGVVMLEGQQVARVAVEGTEVIDPQTERRFVLQVAVPLAVVMQLQSDTYVAQGTVFADGGSGDGALQTPFEFTGQVPR